jgi:hypothetical protein
MLPDFPSSARSGPSQPHNAGWKQAAAYALNAAVSAVANETATPPQQTSTSCVAQSPAVVHAFSTLGTPGRLSTPGLPHSGAPPAPELLAEVVPLAPVVVAAPPVPELALPELALPELALPELDPLALVDATASTTTSPHPVNEKASGKRRSRPSMREG